MATKIKLNPTPVWVDSGVFAEWKHGGEVLFQAEHDGLFFALVKFETNYDLQCYFNLGNTTNCSVDLRCRIDECEQDAFMALVLQNIFRRLH